MTEQAVNAKILLTRAGILDADDIEFRDVHCPEWAPKGKTPEETAANKAATFVRVRNLTAEARAEFVKKSMDLRNAMKSKASMVNMEMDIEVQLVVASAIDESGQPLFTTDDVKRLGKKSALPVGRCAKVAQEISGLAPEAQEEAGKGSEETLS